MHKYKKYIILWFTALLIVSLFGCTGGSSTGSQGTSQQGTLSVALTDAPTSNGFAAVNVTVSKVRVHQSADATENDAGWSDITLIPARKINLLHLTNGVLEDLGQTPLPAGHYTQLRLVLSANTGTIANSVVLKDTTTEIPLVTPSAVQSGIKLINEFDVAPGQRVDLVLDFDALKSVVKRGNGTYLLKPVIHVIPTVLTGIEGFVDTSLLGDNVMVSSQVSGTVIRSTVPNAVTGEFIIDHLDAGSYDLVITADGHATAVIAGVPVSMATSTALMTVVSTSSQPISMPSSTMHNIFGTVVTNPTISTTTVASVATMQTFSAGPTVTVNSTLADLVSGGTYTIASPIAAPLLGQYGTGTLPIALTPQPDIAGKYTVEASADGFQTQSVEVDISIADVLQNFTLTP